MLNKIKEQDIIKIRKLIKEYENKKKISDDVEEKWANIDPEDNLKEFYRVEKLFDKAYQEEWYVRDELIRILVKLLNIEYKELNCCLLDNPVWFKKLKEL